MARCRRQTTHLQCHKPLGKTAMQAHRQIYDDPQETISVPESMRHQRLEVIFIGLDEPASQQAETDMDARHIAEHDNDILPAVNQVEPACLDTTGQALIKIMQASPYPVLELALAPGVQSPVRDVVL